MKMVRWSPARDMMRMRSEFDRFFDESFDFPRWRWVEPVRRPAVDVAETEDAYAQATLVVPRLRQYVELIAESTDTKLELGTIPTKPHLVASLAAMVLQIPLKDKQSLLSINTVPAMLARANHLLLREQQLLQAKIGTEYRFSIQDSLFSVS